MRIPSFTSDLAVIQRLSDLPNSSDGLTAAELKAKFDEAPLEVKRWINEELVPAIQAENIPFTASSAIEEDNLQDAIENVQAQISGMSSGIIANGSVTKAKLSPDLLERVFGGRPWVSMNNPTSKDNVAAGFPIGQIWLTQGFTAVNHGYAPVWSCQGCTMEGNTITGDRTASVATITQSLTNIGKEGDRVWVLVEFTGEVDGVNRVTVSFNHGAEQELDISSGSSHVLTPQLTAGGSLQIRFTTTWSSASLASEGWTFYCYRVVNWDSVARQLPEEAVPEDWTSTLDTMFGYHYFPREQAGTTTALYVQLRDGVWWELMTEGANDCFLRCQNGSLGWIGTEDLVTTLGSLRMATGTYRGTGENRTIDLHLTPKLLLVSPDSGPKLGEYAEEPWDNPEILRNGAKTARYVNNKNSQTIWQATVELSDSELKMTGISSRQNPALLCNRIGVDYTWVAIY